ncbi:caprin-2-like [Mya arenaria]|uniref:caprin-2-like n=1 Tax=Mya arenaria TaxID=6604 RepID=UPI0022E333F6|nr:caprin-2-like [Mya arenaria]
MKKLISSVILIAFLVIFGVIAREIEDNAITNLIERLDAKDAVIEELIGRVELLEKTNMKQVEINEDLERRLQQLTISTQQKDNQKNANTELETNNEWLQKKTETDTGGDENKEDTSGIAHKHKHVTLGDSISRNRRHAYTRAIAFFATATNNSEHLGNGQTIIFDNDITNVGSAYNNHQGVFIAPIDGIYVFSATLSSFPNTADHLKWVKNGQILCYLYVHSSGYDTSGSTIVVELNTGDDISIQNIDPDIKIHGGQYTFFSGFLLKETETESIVIG